jgi:hypothetical protein
MPKKPKIIRIEDGPHIEEPQEVGSSLAAAREALRLPHLKLSHSFLRGELIFVLDGPGAVQANLENRRHPVLPLLDGHWLGLQLKFRTALSRAELRSASLIVLKGQGAQEPKVPLLRAEWERPLEDESRSHAQPHWHVYGSPQPYRDLDRPEPAPRVEPWTFEASRPRSLQVVPGDGMSKFHLAMASQWHVEGSHS